jgi:hypothetical protein
MQQLVGIVAEQSVDGADSTAMIQLPTALTAAAVEYEQLREQQQLGSEKASANNKEARGVDEGGEQRWKVQKRACSLRRAGSNSGQVPQQPTPSRNPVKGNQLANRGGLTRRQHRKPWLLGALVVGLACLLQPCLGAARPNGESIAGGSTAKSTAPA